MNSSVTNATIPLMKIENLTKTFSKKDFSVKALDNISCEIYNNEILAIMGTSGSGKSTLLNIMAAIDAPSTGKIFFNGVQMVKEFEEPLASKFRKENIGFVFQNFNLLDELSVTDNVALPLILLNEKPKVIPAKVEAILEKLAIKDLAVKKPYELSGGQKQRVAIARALISKPLLLLADEPTGALDVNTTNEILAILVDLKTQLKQTIVLVTHDPFVSTYADRVLFFHKGKLVDIHKNNKDEEDLNIIFEKFKNIQGSYVNA